MDLPFTKLRTAGDAWILLDLRNTPMKDADFSAIARELCHRTKGACSSGLIVLETAGREPVARAWSRTGTISPLHPAASLCTARWLFDTGNLSGDAISFQTLQGSQEVLVLDSRIFSICLGIPVAEKIKRTPGEPWLGGDSGLQKNYIGSSRVKPGRSGKFKSEQRTAVMLWDGPLPKKQLRTISSRQPESNSLVYAGIISRGRIEVHAAGSDALRACGLALAAARTGGFCEQETNCSTGDGFVLAYMAADNSVFTAGSVSYCLRGQWWYED